MEEMLGNVPAARQIFERWMAWEPDDPAWTSFIKVWRILKQHCICSYYIAMIPL
jgi:hypothetical protein